MQNNTRIIFLNRFFYPDHSATSQILSDLAFALAEKGWPIHIITSRQRYDDPQARLARHANVRGVVVHRVWTSRFGRGNLLGRSFDYLSFYASAAWRLWRLARRGDIVVVKTDPPLLSVIAAPIAWIKSARLINWLQDIYPEIAQVQGIGRGFFAYPVMKLLYFFRNRSLQSARLNVVIGNRMSQKLRALKVPQDKIRVIPNWADGDCVYPVARQKNPLRKEWQLGGRFVVGYSGNFGRTHEFDTVLEAMKIISAKSGTTDIVFLFTGGGARLKELELAVRKNRLANVCFRPYQPRERLAQSLSAADIHLVSLRPEYEGLVVPSKFYGIAAAGRATAFVGSHDGEIAAIIKQADCGFTVQPGDGVMLAQKLLDLAGNKKRCREMGANARSLFETSYDLPIAIDKWEAVLKPFIISRRL